MGNLGFAEKILKTWKNFWAAGKLKIQPVHWSVKFFQINDPCEPGSVFVIHHIILASMSLDFFICVG